MALRFLSFAHDDSFRLKNDIRYFVKVFAVVAAQRLRAAFNNIATADSNGGIPRQPDGANPRPAVFDADNRVAVREVDTQANTGGFGIQPGVRLGGEFTQGSGAAFAQGESGGNDGIVEILGIAHPKGLESIQDFRPGFFVKAGSHQANLDVLFLEFVQELGNPFGGCKGVGFTTRPP